MVTTVNLDVGGTKYRVSKSLIAQYPNTMLARLISDTWNNQEEQEELRKQQLEEARSTGKTGGAAAVAAAKALLYIFFFFFTLSYYTHYIYYPLCMLIQVDSLVKDGLLT